MEVDAAYPAATAGDELRRLLTATLSDDKASVDAATAGLDRISAAGDPRFPIALLAVAAGTLPHTTPVDPVPSCRFSCVRFCGSPWLFAAWSDTYFSFFEEFLLRARRSGDATSVL